MAEKMLKPDALDLDASTMRRRARRRLVGAVAIALTAVVVVPMLFDPDPKPLGADVEINIPAQDTPFEPESPAVNAPEPAAQAAEATLPEANDVAPDALPPQEKALPAPAVVSKETKSVASKPASVEKALEKAVAVKPAVKAEPKPTAKPDDSKNVAQAKTASKPAKADAAFASKGFYLQLGAFSSEPNAQALLKKVNDAGFKASLLATNGQYRVRVGPIAERDKAEQMAAKLKEKGLKPLMIGP